MSPEDEDETLLPGYLAGLCEQGKGEIAVADIVR